MACSLFVTSFRNEGEHCHCSLFVDSICYVPIFRLCHVSIFSLCSVSMFSLCSVSIFSLCYVLVVSLRYVWCLDALDPQSAHVARFAR